MSCITIGSNGSPEMPALVFAGVRARVPLTLNVRFIMLTQTDLVASIDAYETEIQEALRGIGVRLD